MGRKGGELIDVMRISNPDKHLVEHSRRRSHVRRNVLLYMDKIDGEVSVFDISRGIEVCYSSVYGAIYGRKDHYSKASSLLGLGLVKLRRLGNNMILLSLTDRGYDEVRLIKKEGCHDRDVQLDQEL